MVKTMKMEKNEEKKETRQRQGKKPKTKKMEKTKKTTKTKKKAGKNYMWKMATYPVVCSLYSDSLVRKTELALDPFCL